MGRQSEIVANTFITAGCVIVGAVVIATCAVFAVAIVTSAFKRECPICGADDGLHEMDGKEIYCTWCGHHWLADGEENK